MARCVDCIFYPWDPEADVNLLPAQRCHSELPLQRWTNETKTAERECPFFKLRSKKADSEKEQVKEQPKEKAKEQEKESAKKPKSGRGKKAKDKKVKGDDTDG